MPPFPRRPACAVAAGLLLLALAATAQANPIRTGFSATDIPGNDDGSLGPLPLGFNVNFYGHSANSVFINTNGSLTLDQALNPHSPFDLASTGRQIIAPFFADVDTSDPGTLPKSGLVNYGTLQVDGHDAFAATWPGVGFYQKRADLLNQFQAVLINRSDTGAGNFDVEFNYGQIQWESGNNSNGINGLGGASARVGFSDGTAANSFELPGSAVPGSFLDNGPAATSLIHNSLNSSEQGRYVFSFRDGQFVTSPPPDGGPEPGTGGGPDSGPPPSDPPPSDSPEPATLVLAGAGLLLLGGCAARRRRFPAETSPAAVGSGG